MGPINNDSNAPSLLKQREECNFRLKTDPHNPAHHLHRGWAHYKLGFPDLAAADAYRALTLLEAVVDSDGSEYQARKRLNPVPSLGTTDSAASDASFAANHLSADSSDDDDDDSSLFEPISMEEYEAEIGSVYVLLVRSLLQCGCLRDAYEFCMQALDLSHGTDKAARNKELEKLRCMIKRSVVEKLVKGKGVEVAEDEEEFDPARLDARGAARRVLYPWNAHEPDRNTSEVVSFLNNRLQSVAPKCEVRAVALPSLRDASEESANSAVKDDKVSVQLGLFAKEDIAPGEAILHESSMLTATNRLHDDFCDACNSPLPELSASEPPVACEECADTIFCSQKCHDAAQDIYHRAVCSQEGLETIGRDIRDPKDKADYLYLLLLGRALAMAATQEVHPLDLPEVKYIWGDFHELEDGDCAYPGDFETPPVHPPSATLPFSFQLNVLQPMRILEEMDIDPFASLHLYDTWVLNTLYAKFRGTASGRLSTWDGGPEVCAVHPLWCLANHSCDPNVRWEWGGEITFMVRSPEEMVQWGPEADRERRRTAGPGVKKDEEILNHYCDLELVVKERREWAMGALGGTCQCPRCMWEAAQ